MHIARRIFDSFVLEAAAHIWFWPDLFAITSILNVQCLIVRIFPIWLALFGFGQSIENINLFANFIQLHNNLLNVFPETKIQQMSKSSASFVIQWWWWWGNSLPFKIYPWRWCDELEQSQNHQVSKTHIEMASKNCPYLCVKSLLIHYFMSSFAFVH